MHRYVTGILLAAASLSMPRCSSGQAIPSAYDQPYRPQIHFSPERNWTNDPNGLVYFEGEYHLFYQYNPYGDTWGHMSWGHAVSHDLLHWQELPIAIPEYDGEMIFTGSVVVDEGNSSGLCSSGKSCLVAIFTTHRSEAKPGEEQRETQSIASSQDRGRTWQLYGGNPVLDLHMKDFRDPSVSWNRLTKSWLMAVSQPNEHKVDFYSSPDLKRWKQVSTFGPTGATGGQWECPDLLEIPRDDGRGSVWALKVGINPGSLQGGSGEQFFLGSFDGSTFTRADEPSSHGWTDYGKDSYCAISYNHLPAKEQPTLIGWMNNWQYADKLPTSPWRGQMTIPRRVVAKHDAAGMSLSQEPVVSPLRIGAGKPFSMSPEPEVHSGELLRDGLPLELLLSYKPADAQRFGLRLYSDDRHWTDIGFDESKGVLYIDRANSGATVDPAFPVRTEAPMEKRRPFDMHIILDRSSIEVFAQGGTIAMTDLLFPRTDRLRVTFFRIGGTKRISVRGTHWKLESIWARTAKAATPKWP